MKKKNKLTNTQNLNLIVLLNIFWKEKFIILSIFLIVLLSNHFYLNNFFNATKIYKTELKLKSSNQINQVLYEIDLILSDFNEIDIPKSNDKNNFFKNFKENLTSVDNIYLFFNENNNIEDFKLYLKQKSIKPKDYFLNNFNFNFNENNLNKLSLLFPTELEGDKFLNEYVKFMFEKSTKEYVYYLTKIIDYTKDSYLRALELANKIELEEPFLQSVIERRSPVIGITPDTLFYKGSKILRLKMKHLVTARDNISSLNINFDPILEEALEPAEIVSESIKRYNINAILLSIFMSLILVFIRNMDMRIN